MNQLVKERLTGAIILVALMVLLVPELLTGPVRPAAVITGSSAEEPPLRSYTISLSDEARSRAQPQGGGPDMPQPRSADAPATAQPGDAATPPPAMTAHPANTSPQNTATIPQNTAPPSVVTPHASGATAPPAKIASHPSKAHTSASNASRSSAPSASHSSGTGWMVQLGVFASRDNAEHLAQEMKSKGFRASVSDASSASRHLYRVRVGPTPDRAAAQDLQGRLRAAGRSGTLVPLS